MYPFIFIGLFCTLYNALFAASPQQATLIFAGDAMMHKAQIDAARQERENYDFSQYFLTLKDEISAADYAIVNLECPLGGSPYAGYPCFCAPDSYADALRDAGFDMCATANNHTLDRRDRGLKRTLQVLDSRGLSHLGTYRDKEQRDSVIPLIRDINGIKVGFLSYSYATNGIEIQNDVVVDYINKEKILSDIEATRNAGAELICAYMHWGDEYKMLPNSYQKHWAEFLYDQGVELIIGMHPHVIQPAEFRRNTDGRNQLLVYSLGNFISYMRTADTRGGMMVKAFLSRDSIGKAQVDSAAYKLIFTIPGNRPTSNFHLIHPDSVTGQWSPQARNFATRARAILQKHNLSVPEYW